MFQSRKKNVKTASSIACDASLFSVQGMGNFQLILCVLTLCFLCNTRHCSACCYCRPTAWVYAMNFNKYKLLFKRVKRGYFILTVLALRTVHIFILFYFTSPLVAISPQFHDESEWQMPFNLEERKPREYRFVQSLCRVYF